MRIGIYPGSFDPVTLGHLDIIERSSRLVDKLIVAIMNNTSKSPLFANEEKIRLMKEACIHIKNVEVESFDGLLIEYMKKKDAQLIIKGLRSSVDFDYEVQLALMNKHLRSDTETLFLLSDSRYSYISSSLVKEIAKLGGSIKGLVPEVIEQEVYRRFK